MAKRKSSSSKRRHRRQGSDPVQSDPCTNLFIHQLGSVIEYLDNSCTSAVEGIHFPGDSSTALGDMDTVDFERYLETAEDTTTVDYSEVKPVYSYTTGEYDTEDASTGVWSASSRTSYSTSPQKKKGSPQKFHIVGRLHAKAPETNTPSPVKKKGTFDDNSIVTAPTDSFGSSKGSSDANMDTTALAQNLQNTVIEEEQDEMASQQERRPSNASSYRNDNNNNAPPPSPAIPRKPMTEEEKKNAAIAQGLDLCRRIQQSYRNPKLSPMQQGSFSHSPSTIGNASELPPFRQSLDTSGSVEDPAFAAAVPKTKMYGEKAKQQQRQQEAENIKNYSTATKQQQLLPPVGKRKSTGMEKFRDLKGMVPFGTRKASF